MKLDEKVFLLALYSHGETPRQLIYSGTVPINHKRARSLLEKWFKKGWYDFGVTLDLGWLTSKGISKAKEVLNECNEQREGS